MLSLSTQINYLLIFPFQGDVETGTALIRDPLVKKVSFTGSIPTGRKIMQVIKPIIPYVLVTICVVIIFKK